MLHMFRTDDEKVHQIDRFEQDCWIHLTAPTAEELAFVRQQTGVETDFLHAPLDEEERSRIEVENDQTLIIVDTPALSEDGQVYDTLPFGMVMLPDIS